MKNLLDSVKALGRVRLAIMGAVAVSVLGIIGVLAFWRGGTRMALLYGGLELRESSQIIEQLGAQHIPYELTGQGTEVFVPAEVVPRARVLLAREGLPSGGSVGYEIFDRGNGLATTEFEQNINETRALEGEIARTIRAVNGVRGARVHLVLPRREPFSRAPQEAQASVLLTIAGEARIDREGVQAIVNLVAAAVPGLKPNNIAIIDNRGNMLARAGVAIVAAVASSTEEIRHSTEMRLSRAVEEMLERTVGSGRVRAEAAVEMDFDHLQEVQERYDPDGQVLRSQQSVSSNSKSTDVNTNVSVQNSLPNADAANGTAGTQESRQEETTNYEIGKIVRTITREQPQIHRISVAVMVDGITEPGADGRPGWHARDAEELREIASLVKGAIGYSEQRGDHVEVISMRFASNDSSPAPETSGWLAGKLESSDLLRLADVLTFGVLGSVGLIFIVRPIIVRLASGSPLLAPEAQNAAPDEINTSGPSSVNVLPSSSSVDYIQDQSMISIAPIEDQIGHSTIRNVAELVHKHPEQGLRIVRGWLNEELQMEAAEKASNLRGTKKAAILMLALGETHCKQLLEMMREDEISEISGAMSLLGTVRADTVESLCLEFMEAMEVPGTLIGSFESTERLLQKALPPERVTQIMEEIRGSEGRTTWDKLGKVSEDVLASYLKNEYPQTVAVILSKLRPEHAARVLALLPESFAIEVIARMLRMDSVRKEVLDGVERTLRTDFMSNLSRSSRRDAHEMMADIFNSLDRQVERRFMSAMEQRDRDAAERIRSLMFTFDDLQRLSPAAMQVLMRSIEKEKLPIALKGASDAIRSFFLSNLSERAGRMLKDEIDAIGPVKLRDVDHAQAGIVALARDLAARGEIEIPDSKQEELVY
ncbi:MAG: flagellar M-ring protein FliF [Acidobacteriaceae bacterium]|nr:flagellar M-ring protein FliF [Acidobacteriaceae bacterium]